MRPATHSITLILIGFIAGAAAAFALGQLEAIPAAPDRRSSPAQAAEAQQQTATPGFAEAVANAGPAVVKVYGTQLQPAAASHQPQAPYPSETSVRALSTGSDDRQRLRARLGSGVIISGHGLIVTSAHVVRGLERIQVELVGGRTLQARRLGTDEATDLAVLQVSSAELPAITLGDPSQLRTGDVVLTIGNPYGLGQTVSLGIVSAVGRSHLGLTEVEDFIQTDAAINPGSSGGALVDIQGRLVGIATAALSESGHSEGLGFAIPASRVVRVVEAIVERDGGARGWLGLGGRSVTAELEQRFGLRTSSGVLVSTIDEHGPAAAAGVRVGDVITALAGHEVDNAFALQALIGALPRDEALALVLWRGSERIDLSVARR
jgi:S1-C subfamily serine protease